jgi:hypothetical protein
MPFVIKERLVRAVTYAVIHELKQRKGRKGAATRLERSVPEPQPVSCPAEKGHIVQVLLGLRARSTAWQGKAMTARPLSLSYAGISVTCRHVVDSCGLLEVQSR